jgi:Rrf2 family protein
LGGIDLRLSRESRYAVTALAWIASRGTGAIMESGRVAESTGLPSPFLAKTFVKLTRYGILRSHRGRRRGYELARPPGEISVRSVIEAVEGPDVFERCIFWTDECSEERPCPLHGAWKKVRPEIAGEMERTTLADLTTSGE